MLARVAGQNSENLKGRVAPIDIRTENAVETDYGSGTIYYMFNPFGRATLAAVIERIQQTLVEKPRGIWIVYHNPQHLDVLRAARVFNVEVRTEKRFPWRPQKVAFARNDSQGRECENTRGPGARRCRRVV